MANFLCTNELIIAEMEYCASTASMLVEEIWQIVEEFVEVPVEEMCQMINNVNGIILWEKH